MDYNNLVTIYDNPEDCPEDKIWGLPPTILKKIILSQGNKTNAMVCKKFYLSDMLGKKDIRSLGGSYVVYRGAIFNSVERRLIHTYPIVDCLHYRGLHILNTIRGIYIYLVKLNMV